MRSESTPYNPAHHRIAIFIAVFTFITIIAGALVTSEDAGLSVPDWPTSYGHYLKLPPWVGGVVYEHSHRMIAAFTGLSTIVIAFWTWFVDRRRWMKALAFGALATIVAQGVLGGITVLHLLPPAISTAHATVAQTFFAIAVAIAVFTGRQWVEGDVSPVADKGHPKLLVLCLYSILFLYIQLIFGAMFRHHGMPWWPHVVNSLSVALVLTWTAIRALLQFPRIDAIRRAAVLLLVLLVIQLFLGFAAFWTRVSAGPETIQATAAMVFSTVAHVAVGALLLATAAVLTVEVWRHAPARLQQEVPHAIAA
ncbi:MAG: COX15/CtaA family protein [Acidobacteria bacterium]|nr:COX15/CtaA family protein [Acidobacteriota bacterium]MBV9625781.1 COX15/CtaA family protein [Acidobacteriota bacterium]